ncbi:cytochrome c oxidase subunit II [Aquibium sp. A9E412]|uniref:cytochrome c oxidase subunit II n=1 Tax=Aquibium sp. A9E412 TaxID=2976767 RepID=UPI0025AECE82|nr:cytochrome c oxidase subunit II [Aquibium sp. A9E412]MDN2564880.1 cytochrome c oxidase subunit II [Aquibium sp. A9E412]
MRARASAAFGLAVPAIATAACSGPQSALDPHGVEAQAVATLFWWMTLAGALIWCAVIGALVYAGRRRRRVFSARAAGRIVLWAGAVTPSVLLLILLGYGLALMPDLRPASALTANDRLHVEVVGEQFWWRVIYHRPDGPPVVSANEVRLPVGTRVAFSLKSADVIHAFWIPQLGGKMDMIPGRTNRFSLQATRAGTFRGPCTEFCGPSHALMAFAAVAMDEEAFAGWLEREAGPAVRTEGPGLDAFLANGCGACHTIRGTPADGTIGPDLTHLGARKTLAAGALPNTEAAIARFVAAPEAVKPGARMPAFGMLPEREIAAIAAYLAGLE